MDKKYWILADHLSDHLWMTNNLDLDILKDFPEFHYEGEGFRVLFLDNKKELNLKDCLGRSFAKSISFCKVKYIAANLTAPATSIPIVFKTSCTSVFH